MTLIVIVTAGLLLPLSLLLFLFLHRRNLPRPLYEPSGLSIGAIFDSSLPNPQDEPPGLSIGSIFNSSLPNPQDEPSGGLSSSYTFGLIFTLLSFSLRYAYIFILPTLIYYYISHNPYDLRLIISDPVTCCLTHKPLNFLLLFFFLVHVIPVYFFSCSCNSCVFLMHALIIFSSPYLSLSFSVLSIIRSISNVSFLDPQDDPPDDPQDEPSGGLSSTLVQKLPQFKTSKPARPDGSECVVCLDGFRKGRWCRRLPGCGHVFHRKCVDTWFLRADTCPTCRASVRLTE